jgi:hypothetical protein
LGDIPEKSNAEWNSVEWNFFPIETAETRVM